MEGPMTASRAETIVVCGVTGRQGGAVARHLVADGWHVLGLTRNASSPKARGIADGGVEVVQADMADRAALDRALAGAYGLYSVQSFALAGPEDEVTQGRTVADAAKAAGVQHVVYGSSGTGARSGVPSWDTKVAVTEHMREIGLPLTVLRPECFMEIMLDKEFYPPVTVWHIMPKLAGSTTTIPWLAVDDLGAVAAKVFADRERYLGHDIPLAGDVKSIDECRAIWREVNGKAPSTFPMPEWLFRRIAGPSGKDLPIMWRWLRSGDVPKDPAATRAIHPGALTVRQRLERQRNQQAG
jgi:uncharacterized protein YbjT (DUF2867 family)